ncbi:MAG: TIGR03936 family radical SAM-associated protein [Eubacteriales bacterium]|nr:TIGR03936 family radical SAM-associated protein [Eubacteriales bacterium]
MKIRIKWTKTGVLKFIGHLDVQRYFHKAMLRAELPISFSKGMSPHQITSFAAPLGIGMTSEGEYMDATFDWSYSSEEMMRRLNAVMNEGISILEFHQIDEKEKNCMAVTAAADYMVSFREGYYNKEAFTKRCEPFFFQESINVVKKTKRSEKEVDIAPMILEIRGEGDSIFMKLVTGSAENLKPHTVMEAFCNYLGYDYDPVAFMYHRLETYLERNGKLMPLGAVGKDLMETTGYEEFMAKKAAEAANE